MAEQKRQLLLVDGPVTTVLNVEVAREVDTLDFFDKVQIPRNSVVTPLLPHNTRLYRATSTTSKYILEEPPAIWMVSHASANGAIFQIAVPWTLFSVSVGHNSSGVPQTIGQPVIVFSRAKIQTEDTRLAKSFLPNQQASGLCCAGDDYARIMSSRDPLLTRLNKIVPFFKNSMFNEDLRPTTIPTEIVNLTNDSQILAGIDRENFARNYMDDGISANLRLLAKWHLWTMAYSNNYTNPRAALDAVCNSLGDTWGRFSDFAR